MKDGARERINMNTALDSGGFAPPDVVETYNALACLISRTQLVISYKRNFVNGSVFFEAVSMGAEVNTHQGPVSFEFTHHGEHELTPLRVPLRRNEVPHELSRCVAQSVAQSWDSDHINDAQIAASVHALRARPQHLDAVPGEAVVMLMVQCVLSLVCFSITVQGLPAQWQTTSQMQIPPCSCMLRMISSDLERSTYDLWMLLVEMTRIVRMAPLHRAREAVQRPLSFLDELENLPWPWAPQHPVPSCSALAMWSEFRHMFFPNDPPEHELQA